MRIGTWNLAGRWSDGHRELLESSDCDVWLLTEVSGHLVLPGYGAHSTQALMAPGRRWSAILSRERVEPLPDPHPASAMARVGGTTYVSSILPWRSCGPEPWGEGPHAARTERAVHEILAHLIQGPLVWGGDWNHALDGPEYAGSRGGRVAIHTALEALGLRVPTRDLMAAGGGQSIDHVAVDSGLEVKASLIAAVADGHRLSDHDAYLVEISDRR
jgi:hypothetical protein